MSKKEMIEENGVTLPMVLITLMLTALVLLLTMPNIYLDNQLYYESRKIAHLNKVKIMLQEEQAVIETRLEKIYVEEHLK